MAHVSGEESREAKRLLNEFLHSRKVGRDDPKSHSCPEEKKTYYIDNSDLDEFYKLTCNAVHLGVALTLMELVSEHAYVPLRVDFDFKTPLADGTLRKYDDEMLVEIVKIHQQVMRELADPDVDDGTFSCVVLEKSAPRVETDYVKDGFHLHFPFFACQPHIAELIRQRTIKILNERKILYHISKDTEKIVDKIATKPWHMYGCGKSKKAEPYRVTMYLDGVGEKSSPKKMFGVLVDGDGGSSMRERFDAEDKKTSYFLPCLLAIRGLKTPVPLNPAIEEMEKANLRRKARRGIGVPLERPETEVIEDLETIRSARFLEDMLSIDRASDYNKWIDVGMVLHNIGAGRAEALDMWIDFSKRVPDAFKEGVCEAKWETFKMRNRTITSIFKMAEMDTPLKFMEWKNMTASKLIDEVLKNSKPVEGDVAKVFKAYYKDKFVCVAGDKHRWYEFENHRWVFRPGGIRIRLVITNEFRSIFRQAYLQASSMMGKIDDGDVLERSKRCGALIVALGQDSFVKKLMNMCADEFNDHDFEKRLDSNRQLWVCNNGVIDFGGEGETPKFREGRPDDYMCLTSGVNYYEDMSEDDVDVKEVKECVRKIIPNDRVRQYVFDIVSVAMRGQNRHKKFLLFTGSKGNNGKSTLFKLFEKLFGDYSHKFPQQMFISTNRVSSSSARPELSAVRGKRLASTQEISKEATVDVGVVKELTGNDTFFARGLYKEGSAIEPMFTLMMQLNELFKMQGTDKATWNRVRKIDCNSLFDDDAPLSVAEQNAKSHYPRDKHIEAKFGRYAEAFLWVLVEHIKEHKDDELFEPPEVLAATEEYRTQNDPYLEFRDEVLEKTDADDDEKLDAGLTYGMFKIWYKENYNKAPENRLKFQLEMIKHLGRLSTKGRNKTWSGWKMRDIEPPLLTEVMV